MKQVFLYLVKLTWLVIFIHGLGLAQRVPMSFNGGDPDSGDTVTYTVWISTDSTFTHNVYQTETSANWNVVRIQTLSPVVDPLTTYYWYVKAVDNHGAIALGPVWRFTTSGFDINEPPPYLIVKQTIYLARPPNGNIRLDTNHTISNPDSSL